MPVQVKLESGAEIADHGVTEPRTYDVTGIVSASLAESDTEVVTRLTGIHAALIGYANTRQPVTLVSGTWTDDVTITNVSTVISIPRKT